MKTINTKNRKHISKKNTKKIKLLMIKKESNKSKTYLKNNIRYLKNLLFKSDNIFATSIG